MVEYDKIAESYASTEEVREARKYIIDHTFMKVLGDVKGKSVLDLACGDGNMTRKIKKVGSGKTFGADISSEMIKLAKKREAKEKLGISYLVEDVVNMGKIDSFDVVTGVFLLNYSKTEGELKNMVKNISANLKSGGRAVFVMNNPESPLIEAVKHGITMRKLEPIKDGSKFKGTLYVDGKEVCSFININWSKKTIEKIFKESGFKLKFNKLEVSKEGLKHRPKSYWQDFIDSQYLTVLEAFKK